MRTPIDELIMKSKALTARRGKPRLESPLLTGNREYDKRFLKSLIALNGLTPTDIAQALGMKSQSVSQVIHRTTNSQRVTTFLENLPIQV